MIYSKLKRFACIVIGLIWFIVSVHLTQTLLLNYLHLLAHSRVLEQYTGSVPKKTALEKSDRFC